MSGWNEGGGYEAEASDVAPAAAPPAEVIVPEVPAPSEIPSQVASNEIVTGNADETASPDLSSDAESDVETDTIDPNEVGLDNAAQSGAASESESEDVVSPDLVREDEGDASTTVEQLTSDADPIHNFREASQEITGVEPGDLPASEGRDYYLGKHITDEPNSYDARGWTLDSIRDLVDRPSEIYAARDIRFNENGQRNDDPATACVDQRGHYIVIKVPRRLEWVVTTSCG